MPSYVAPSRPVIVTSCRTLAMERSHARQIRAELDPCADLGMLWYAAALDRWDQVVPLARDVVRGAFRGRQVEEREDSFRIHDPFLFFNLRQDLVLSESWRDEARLTMMSDLTRLGYRVAALAADPKVYEYVDPTQLDQVKAAGVAEEDIIFLSRTTHDEPIGSLSFPRDLFVQLEDTVYVCPGEHNPYKWQDFFEWAKGLRPNFSRVGNGGEVVLAGDYALLSQPHRPDPVFFGGKSLEYYYDLAEMSTIGETEHTLERKGVRVHRIPTGWMELLPPEVLTEVGSEKPLLCPCDHADMQVLHLPAENALFFSERYYRDNREVVERIVDQERPNIFGTLPDEDGMPINSLPLPNGGVYLDAAAKKAITILRQAGIRVEETSIPYGSWAWGTNGGIHCSTNQINFPD